MSTPSQETLLAVDLGVRTGLALYGRDGRLIWCRSFNFGTTSRIGRGAKTILSSEENLSVLLIEGGGMLANKWEREAARLGIEVMQVQAETWRERLLFVREQRDARSAKENAIRLAWRVIRWSGAPRPSSLRHDAAEAVLAGLWGVLELGWLNSLPREIRL